MSLFLTVTNLIRIYHYTQRKEITNNINENNYKNLTRFIRYTEIITVSNKF